MLTFIVEYYRAFGYGAYDETYFVVIANTKSEALGLAMDQIEDSRVCDFELIELETSFVGVNYITGHQS